jgi:hypothetical protein
MSIEKYLIAVTWIATIAVTVSASAADRYGGDGVLEFYCTRSAEAANRMNPIGQRLSFTLATTSHYKRIDSHGKVSGVDTAEVQYWFREGVLDSQVVRSAPSGGSRSLSWSLPDVFAEGYLYTFYPNDAGGKELAIGFDTPKAADSLPVGLMIIDRESYLPRRFYLHYPNRPGYKRFSLGYRLSERDGFLFPDSIWEVAAKEAVFSTENYRRETRVDSVRILPE